MGPSAAEVRFPESASSGSKGWAQTPTAKPARARGVSERNTRAPAGEAPKHRKAAVPGGPRVGGRGPRPLSRPGRLECVPGSGRAFSPPGLATLAGGTPGGQRGPRPTRVPRERAQGKAGARRPASGSRLRLLPVPYARGPGGAPSRRPQAARGCGPGGGKSGPGRRSVLTGTDILAAAPGARASSGAGRRGAQSAALSAPSAVPALSGLLRAPGAGSRRSRGSCALPAAGLSGRPSPRRACAARAAPPPRGSPARGRVKGEDPEPGVFLSAQRGDGARSPPSTHPSGTTLRHTISWLPAGSGSLNAHPTPNPTLPSPGLWAPARFSGRAPSPCV